MKRDWNGPPIYVQKLATGLFAYFDDAKCERPITYGKPPRHVITNDPSNPNNIGWCVFGVVRKFVQVAGAAA